MSLDARWLGEALFYGGLLAAALLDLRHRRIPNALTVPFLAAGLLLQLGLDGWGGAWSGVQGAGLGLLLLLVPFALRLVGGGDVKLLAAMGGWLGPAATVISAALGFAFGAILIVILLARNRDLRRQVAANLRTALLGSRLPEVERRPLPQSVALGAALAAGGIFTHLLRWGT